MAPRITLPSGRRTGRGRWRAPASTSASRQERRLRINTGTGLAAVVAVAGMSIGPARLGAVLFVMTATVVALDAVVAVNVTRTALLTANVRPTDVVAGERFSIQLRVHRTFLGLPGARPRLCGKENLPLLVHLPSGPVLVAEPPTSGSLDGTVWTRGVVHELELSVESSGLCGLISCTRSHKARLDRPLDVGPRPVVPPNGFPEVGGAWGEDGAVAVPADGELVRGLRSYVSGDRLRQVHWRATARHGELIVKDAEEPQAPLLHVVLDLGAGGEAGEAAAGRTAWYAGEALRRRYEVTLTTVEDGHPLTAATPSLLLVNRRLARAGTGAIPRPKSAAPGVRVLVVSDNGDSWP